MRAATILAFIASLLIQVGFPLGMILYFRRRTRAPWGVFLLGAAVFAVFQLFTWLPFSAFLEVVWGDTITDPWGAFLWLVIMALATSIVEEGGRWLGYRYLFPRRNYTLTWRNGVAYGLGHGALESMWFIAGLTFITFILYLVLSRGDTSLLARQIGQEGMEQAAVLYEIATISWEQPLIVAFERVLALVHQVAWALLVMESLASSQKRWFFFAVLYHASIAIIVPGLARLFGFAVAEVLNLGFAGISLWIVAGLYSVSEQRF